MQVKAIALYIRLSIEDVAVKKREKQESNSISNQRSLLLQYVKKQAEFKDACIYEFCDDGFSGTNFDRPQFQDMIERAQKKEIDCVIAKDFSRFGRDYLELGAYIEQIFPAWGVRFISVNDHYDSNRSLGTAGGIDIGFKNLSYSLYSRDLSRKAKSARKSRAERGEFLGAHAPYGYQRSPENKRAFVIDEEAAPIIQEIFFMAANGKSTYEIARRLNMRKIPCPYEYKRSRGERLNKPLVGKSAVWGAATVKQIIKDERYTGKMVSNKSHSIGLGKKACYFTKPSEWVVVSGTHEAIISEEEFAKANAGLAERLKVVNYNTGWKNSANFFVCGHCGHRLQKTKGKETCLYCLKGKENPVGACGSVLFNREELESSVLKTVQTMARVLMESSRVMQEKGTDKRKGIEKSLWAIEKQIQRIKNGKMELYTKYKEGIVSRDSFLKIQEENKKDVEELQRKQEEQEASLVSLQGAENKLEEVKDWYPVDALTEFNPYVLSQIIEKVLLYENGQMEIKFKNADSIEQIIQYEKQEVS